ncbi:MAG: sulfatase [Halobacteriales archaeon]
MPDRHNVVLVLADQHRAGATGPAGNPDVHTPALDRLAAEGTRCTGAYANVPVCTPSRASVLTGRYPQSTGVIANDLALAPEERTLGEAFRDAGYRTAYVGKWHLDGVPRDGPTPPERRHGFGFWAAFNCTHQYVDAPYYRDGELRRHEWGPAGETDLALEFLDGEEPFFLVVAYGPPHAPYDQVPGRYRERYDPDGLAVPPNAEPIPGGEGTLGPVHEPRELLADYYAQVTAVDDQVGRLLEGLDARGLADDTAVAYTSDHGDMLCSQGLQKKETPHEESVGVPWLVRGPGVPAGETIDAPLGLLDLAPTLCGLSDADPDLPAEGTDRAPLLRGDPDADRPESVPIMLPATADQSLAQGLPVWRGVRTERYTYARLADGTPWLLFDNRGDPHQLRNLALDADHREVRERLDGLTDAWLEDVGDPFLETREQIRHAGAVETWNRRERELPFVDEPRVID